MKKLLSFIAIFILTACASKPFEETKTIYDSSYQTKVTDTTQVRIHRLTQLSGSALGDDCPLVLKVDDKEIAGLQQNQYVDIYVPKGKYILSVRFKCALTEWRKSVEVDANGGYQEFQTETGAAGQYRMWRVK